MSAVTIEDLTVHADARGTVYEPLGPDALPMQRNVHVVVTQPGAIRGNHVHPRGTETLSVQGPTLVRLRDGEETYDVAVPPGRGFRFTIPPGTAHAIRNDGDAPMLLVSFVDVPHNPANTVRVELL